MHNRMYAYAFYKMNCSYFDIYVYVIYNARNAIAFANSTL